MFDLTIKNVDCAYYVPWGVRKICFNESSSSTFCSIESCPLVPRTYCRKCGTIYYGKISDHFYFRKGRGWRRPCKKCVLDNNRKLREEL